MMAHQAVHRTTSGVILTAISALGFSTLPIFAVMAYQHGANPISFLGYRFLLAAIILWAYVLLVRRAPLPNWRQALKLMVMGGVGYTTMSICYVSSVEGNRLSPAFAALLLYTYPAIVTLLAWLFDGARLGWRSVMALLITSGGVALVLLSPEGEAIFTLAGALLALSAAVVYAVYIYIAGKVTVQTPPVLVTTFVSTAAAMVLLGYGSATGSLLPVAGSGWVAIVGTALLATVLAVLLFFAGIERLGSAKASLVSTLEPVGTVLLSAALFGERLGGWQVAGGLLVLLGVGWLAVRKG